MLINQSMGKPIEKLLKLLKLCLLISLLCKTSEGWTTTEAGVNEMTNFACDPPVGLFSQNVTTSTATLSWQDNGTAPLSWNLEVIPVNQPFTENANYTNVTTNPFDATGLLPGTTYKFRVQAVCNTNSVWSNQANFFTTVLTNPSPCNMNLSIPDDTPSGRSFPIEVTNAPGNSLGGNVLLREVRIIIDHSWERDLNVLLVSPDGQQIQLAYRVGDAVVGVGGGYGDLTAPDCEGYLSLTSNYPNDSCRTFIPVTDGNIDKLVGRFFPMNPLSDFNDFSDPNGEWILRVIDDRSSNIGELEFVELVFSEFNCQAPGGVEATDTTGTTLTVDWNVIGTCQGAIIEYGPPGFTPGEGMSSGPGGSIVSNVCPPFELTNLTPFKEYDIYVRNRCTTGGYSENSCLLNITTECDDAVISLSENFDAQNNCTTNCGATCDITGTWANDTDDDFDWIVHNGATPTDNSGPTTDVSGDGKYIYLETNNTPCWNGNKAILTSECIQVQTNDDNCDFSFYYHAFGTNLGGLDLEISEDGGINWILLGSYGQTQSHQWRRVYHDLSTYDGKIVQFRFIGKGGADAAGNIALDEIEFYGSTSLGAPSFTYYVDNDNDGFGDPAQSLTNCLNTPPSGYADNGLDCDDTNNGINPNAVEILCNRIDENCNGLTDDAVLPNPQVEPDTICPGEVSTLVTGFLPEGTYYWFDSPTASTPVASGNSYTTTQLNETSIFYVQDSILNAPGLRITEIGINIVDGVEVQSIGKPGDYTGWKIVIGKSNSNINSVHPVMIDLDEMDKDQILLRTAADFGESSLWRRFLAGWAIIVDDNQNIVDAVFWNWNAAEINTFDITVDGNNYIAADLPWFGSGIDATSCNNPSTLSLAGSTETNTPSDYFCSDPTLGSENTNMDFTYSCSSERIRVEVFIDKMEVSTDIIPNICDKEYAGSIMLDVMGGYGSYSYLWSDGSTEQHLTKVDADNYAVTVTDARGCEMQEGNLLLEAPQFEFSATNLEATDPSCHDFSDGKIKVQFTDGTGPYQLSWSNGTLQTATTAIDSLESLSSGDFNVTVTDDNGCVDSTTFVKLTAPMPIAITTDKQDVSCHDMTNGAITASVAGGVGNYNFQWNTNDSTSEISDLPPGTYSLTVTDANTCAEQASQITISEPAPLQIMIDDVQGNSCLEIRWEVSVPQH